MHSLFTTNAALTKLPNLMAQGVGKNEEQPETANVHGS